MLYSDELDGEKNQMEKRNQLKIVLITLLAVVVFTGCKEKTYTIKFDANGGSGSIEDVKYKKKELYEIKNLFSAPKNSEGSFACWYTKLNGIDTYLPAYDKSNEAMGLIYPNKGNFTLHALWTDSFGDSKFGKNNRGVCFF
jgi:hypothetical protein